MQRAAIDSERIRWLLTAAAFAAAAVASVSSADEWVTYKGREGGAGSGKHIVLVSGDEEYRSEETLPQLAKILSSEHGFDCTMLFAINPKTELIDPNFTQNIPGLKTLEQADLMILFTRRRNLPDEQMQIVDEYLKAGKPVIGLRTATHAFLPSADSKWVRYGDTYKGDEPDWHGGFGRLVLGETWVNHHGTHKQESTRGVIAPGAADHPILRGIKDGEIWCPTDVYEVRLPLPGDSKPLVLGQVTARKGAFDANDSLYGMRPDDGPAVSGAKNDPMMPVAWSKSYEIPGGEPGRAFCTTMGASVDLLNEPLRRLIVNATYWCVGMEDKIPKDGTRVDLVGKYEPTQFGFRDDAYWANRKLKVAEIRKDATAE
jgi:Trehalose utilisation